MMPAIALCGVAPRRWPLVPLPVPVFILWPLILVALGIVALALEARARSLPPAAAGDGLAVAGAALRCVWQLSGVRVDVRQADGFRLLLRLL